MSPTQFIGLCVNGDACPVAHGFAAAQRSGRVCGGHHPALECRSPKIQLVDVHLTPAAKTTRKRESAGAAESVAPKRASLLNGQVQPGVDLLQRRPALRVVDPGGTASGYWAGDL